MKSPLFVILGGPNGAGKSSVATAVLPPGIVFLNADDIARSLPSMPPAHRDFEASRVVLERMDSLAEQRDDFAIETTLASRSLAPRARRLKQAGYYFRLVYVRSASPDFSAERVAARVRLGGHDIPIDTIRRRYYSGLRNLFSLYLPLADSWDIHDNTSGMGPSLIAEGIADHPPMIHAPEIWNALQEAARDGQ
ncbi:MAG: zeta toxin family protein [Isosphaeraceae bacterium]